MCSERSPAVQNAVPSGWREGFSVTRTQDEENRRGASVMALAAPMLLILLLIGTGWLPTDSEAADTQDPAAGRIPWQLPMADQRMLGVCLHMYLERDFPEIQRIVYPAPRPTAAPRDDGSSSRVLVDGPGLEANCQQLSRLLRCFSRSLGRMRYYENFSEFRRLVVALDAVVVELCGAVDLMRHRFLPLLQTLNCIERVRERESCPYRDRLPPNIWHQLIRLETDSSLCWPLTRQLNCVRDSGAVRVHCGDIAHHLFANLSAVFLGHWCLNSGSSLSHLPFLPKLLFLLFPMLPLFSFYLPNFDNIL